MASSSSKMRAQNEPLKATTGMHKIRLQGILQSHMPAMVLTILTLQ